jgi:glycine/serine hydroxymethyltransferase
MTRFGMEEEDFRAVAQLIRDVVVDDRKVAEEVARLRSRFLDLHYCFSGPELDAGLSELRDLI